MNSDPMKDGLNWYQYVRSNPATWVDPWGLEANVVDSVFGFLESFKAQNSLNQQIVQMFLAVTQGFSDGIYAGDFPIGAFTHGYMSELLPDFASMTNSNNGASGIMLLEMEKSIEPLHQIIKMVAKGQLTTNEALELLKNGIQQSLTFEGIKNTFIGNLSYVFEHSDQYFANITCEEARELGRHTYGAIKEAAKIGVAIYATAQAAKEFVQANVLKGMTVKEFIASSIKGNFGNLSKASEYGIKPYSEMTKTLKGSGLQAHHIVEQRFGLNINESVAVTPAEHQLFTNSWRSLIPYGTNYSTLTTAQIWSAAQKVYTGYPAILEVVKKALLGG